MLDILLGRKREGPSISESGGTAILVKLDASLFQSHKYKNKATAYPVESGMDITDHVRQEPEQFEIEGLVTNSPVSFFPLLTDFKTIVNGGKDRVMTAYEALLLICGRKMVKMPEMSGNLINITIETKPKIVDIQTNLRVFNDMIIEDLSFDFDNKTGDALPFKASARRIRRVTTRQATINYTSGTGSGSYGTPDQVADAPKGNQEVKPKQIGSTLGYLSRGKFSDAWDHTFDFGQGVAQ
jgi:hypothetical protein